MRPDLRESFQYALHKDGRKDEIVTFNTLTSGSHKRCVWKCPNTNCENKCEHIYEAVVKNRMTRGCPFCCPSPRRVCNCNSLAGKYPELAKEWGDNGDLQPTDISPFSQKPINWICLKSTCGHHKWTNTPDNRIRLNSGCPYCAVPGKLACRCDCLASKFPELIQEIHPSMNKNFDAHATRPYSHKSIWWQCKTCQLSWKARIKNRTLGSGCIKCRESHTEKNMRITLNQMIANEEIKSFKEQEFYTGTRLTGDFLIETLNSSVAFLEMDGEQHFYPVSFGSKGDVQKMFQDGCKRDLRKKKWCAKHNVRLLRLSYQVPENSYRTQILDFLQSNDQFRLVYSEHEKRKI